MIFITVWILWQISYFFEILKQQEFEIKKIRKSDSLCLFKITDLEDQIFTANQSDINIYSIQGKISGVLIAAVKKTAAKTDAKLKLKLKLNSKSTDFSNTDDNIKLQIISDCKQYQITHEIKKKTHL